MMFGFRQKKVEFWVKAGKPATSSQALIMHKNFVDLTMRCKAELVRTEGARILLRATPRNAAKFQRTHYGLSLAGLI